jgi:hypothetical protein
MRILGASNKMCGRISALHISDTQQRGCKRDEKGDEKETRKTGETYLGASDKVCGRMRKGSFRTGCSQIDYEP